MNKEDKELLLKDLSSRLPYKPLCLCEWKQIAQNGSTGYVSELSTFLIEQFEGFEEFEDIPIKSVKPYLRSISSMSDEEKEEFNKIKESVEASFINAINKDGFTLAYYKLIDWLNAHQFDYRGLIPRDLAIKVTEENNPYK